MFSFFKDFKWQYLKIDITRLLGRTYYFWGVAFWATVDIIVFIALGIQLTTLIVAIPLGITTAVAVIKWLGSLMYYGLTKLTKSKMIEDLSHGTTFQGEQGCGKSSTINELGYIFSAEEQWKKLQYEYFLCMHFAFKDLPNDLQIRYGEIIESYQYYFKYIDTHIPCLHSFYKVYDKHGRQSFDLSKEHLFQKKRLPYRCVLICDEISSMIPNEAIAEVKDSDLLREFIRWVRQFLNGYCFFGDIRAGDAFIAIRSGCGTNYTLYRKQKWLLKPIFLISIKKLLMSFIDFDFWVYRMFKKGSKISNKVEYSLRNKQGLRKFLIWLERLINNVGEREYFFKKEGNKDNGLKDGDVKSKSGRYYFTSPLDIKYNDRVFRELYRAKDMPFDEPSIIKDWYPSEEILRKLTGIKKK